MVRTLQQTVRSVAQGPKAVRTGLADAEVSKFPSTRSPKDYAVIADEGTTLCNCQGTKVFRSRRASEFYEVLVAGPDATYANPSLSRIMISIAYLKRLIGCVL
jgi:hypothetical protein